MVQLLDTSALAGQLVFLGTGTSVGVPCIGCSCDVCTSSNPKNKRLRCGLALGLPEGTLLIDTTPDLRTQCLREGIGLAHAILYTHDHTDHIMGLDDVRMFYFHLKHAMPVWCEEQVESRIRRSFDYAFAPDARNYAGGVPVVDFHRIDNFDPFELLGAKVIPFRLHHGRFQVLGFRIGNVAYCTDTNNIPPESLALLEGLDVLIIDALRFRPHVSHYSIDEAIKVSQQLKPKRTLFTHMGHDIDHDKVSAELPPGIELAYDGLRVELS